MEIFTGKEQVQSIYTQLLKELKPLGSFEEEVKKTSIHLVRKSAFAGVHPRKNALRLTVKADHKLESPRVVKAEKVSASRWHNEVDLTSTDEIDKELLGWLKAAYDMS
jgi:predicted transport protein